MEGQENGKGSERGTDRDRDRESDKHKDKERHRDKEKHKHKSERSERDVKEKDRERHRRDKEKEKRRERSLSPVKEDRKRSRRDRETSKEYERSRKTSRERRRRSRSHSRDRRRGDSSRRDREGSRYRSRHRSESRSPSAEYGGYVPRKRQEPPQQGAGYSSAYIDPYAALRGKAGPATLDPAEIARQMQEQQLKARELVLRQQAASAVAAASKTQREVYVGNLMPGIVTEDALRQLFNTTMAAAFPDQMQPGLDPVINVSMHSEGRYAFVELRTPQMATAALQLSGQVQLLGQPISVGRPSGYVDPTAAQQAALAAAQALAAFQGGDTSQALQQQMADLGIAVPGFTPNPEQQKAYGVIPVAVPEQPAAAADAAAAAGETEWLSVTGMVSVEVLQDDTEYDEVKEDLHEECSKYGQVMELIVPRPADPSTSPQVFGTNNYGQAFVHFGDVEGARGAKEAIHGRLFAGEKVTVAFISQQDYAAVERPAGHVAPDAAATAEVPAAAVAASEAPEASAAAGEASVAAAVDAAPAAAVA